MPSPIILSSLFEPLGLPMGQMSSSEKMHAMFTPTVGDNVMPNNVQELSKQTFYPAICQVKHGTDEGGIKQISPDNIDIKLTIGAHTFVEQTVRATNNSDETASMALYQARSAGNTVICEEQTIGSFALHRTVETNSVADETMKAIEAGTTHTGSISETSDNCTFVKLAKVPAHTPAKFWSKTRLRNPDVAQHVGNGDPDSFFDLVILLPINPIRAGVTTKIRTVLEDGFTIVLPDDDSATGDGKYCFPDTDVVMWVHPDAPDMHFEYGISCMTVLKYRVMVPRSTPHVSSMLNKLSIGDTIPMVIQSQDVVVGFDPCTGRPQKAFLVDVDVPIMLDVPPNSKPMHIFLIVDESGSTYMKGPKNQLTNLQMAKQSTVNILKSLVREHIPLLRTRGVLGEDQRILLTVLMFHHHCRTIVDSFDISQASANIDGICAKILADAPPGGTNFCEFARVIKKVFLNQPDSLVVTCILTDGGAYDMNAFTAEFSEFRKSAVDVRTVVIGFGAWVDEATARHIQTDGYAMIQDLDDRNIVVHAMRLLPKAIIAANRTVGVSMRGVTVVSAVRVDGRKLPMRTEITTGGKLVTSTLLEPGSGIRMLCLTEEGCEPEVFCGESKMDIFETLSHTGSDPMDVLGMVDRIYMKDGVTLLPHACDRHQGIITAIGITYKLGTSYTKPISTMKIPESLVAPSVQNRPVAESLFTMIVPRPAVHCFGPYTSDGCIYRSLGSVGTLDDSDALTTSGTPCATDWLATARRHVHRLTHSAASAELQRCLAELTKVTGSPVGEKRNVADMLLEDIDDASAKNAGGTLPRLSHLATAQACCHTIFLMNGKPIPEIGYMDSHGKIVSLMSKIVCFME